MSDTNKEIKLWKPEDAVLQLKERIRLEFVQMIPAEQFTAMVQQVVNDYLQKRDRGYTQNPRTSDFEQTVMNEIAEATKLEVKKFLSSPEWQGKWDNQMGCKGVSEAIGKLLEEYGAKIVNAWLGQAIQGIFEQMRMRS